MFDVFEWWEGCEVNEREVPTAYIIVLDVIGNPKEVIVIPTDECFWIAHWDFEFHCAKGLDGIDNRS